MVSILINRSVRNFYSIAAGAVLFLVTYSLPAQSITLVTVRDDLGANDEID